MSDKLCTFGATLKKLRKEHGLTQKEFAEAFAASGGPNMTIYTIRNWEQGRTIPENTTIESLCTFFRCDRDALFGTLDCSTHNMQYICKTTGLSERSVECLENYGCLLPMLNLLLETVDFSRVIADISLYMQSALTTVDSDSYFHPMSTFCMDELNKVGLIVTDPKTNARNHYENAIEHLKIILDKAVETKEERITTLLKKALKYLDTPNEYVVVDILEEALFETGMVRKKAVAEISRRIDALISQSKVENEKEIAKKLKEKLQSSNEERWCHDGNH